MRLLFLLSTALALIANQAWALPKSISIVADAWCPYNCDAEGDKKGYVVDIAKAIFEPEGISVHYEIMPWTRAIRLTRNGTHTAVIAATTNEAKKFVFPQEIIGISDYRFYTLADHKWRFNGDMQSIHPISLGVVDGYSYDIRMDAFISKHRNHREHIQVVGGSNASKQNIKKLIAKRIEVMLEDPNVLAYKMNEMGVTTSLRDAGALDTTIEQDELLYLAFSPKHPDAKSLATLFDKGLRKLRKTGKLNSILERYGIKDWK
ncbi:MAG: transporter substrate-binding domain-containing protein [Alphaproteobacteria bacterium]|nr:transporter substrate-binding domain-containing protein [Alphaproteobacteria bacterium]